MWFLDQHWSFPQYKTVHHLVEEVEYDDDESRFLLVTVSFSVITVWYARALPPFCGLLKFQQYMFNMESRHLLHLSLQNALDCISASWNLIEQSLQSQKFSWRRLHAPETVLMGAIVPILLLYTKSMGPLYHKILCPPLICSLDVIC